MACSLCISDFQINFAQCISNFFSKRVLSCLYIISSNKDIAGHILSSVTPMQLQCLQIILYVASLETPVFSKEAALVQQKVEPGPATGTINYLVDDD